MCASCTLAKACQRHTFPFLQLPTELRVAIYQKALQRDTPLNLTKRLPLVLEKPPKGCIRRRKQTNGSDTDNYEGHDINRERNKRVPRAHEESLVPQMLLLCKQIYHEALPVLYRDNALNLHLEFSILPLTKLRQRTRSLIKHVVVTIYEHSDVLNGGFNDLFTNGLRYCFGLETLKIVTKVAMPTDRARDKSYDPNFHILRWLPKGCTIEVKGEYISEGVKKLVDEQNMLAQKLDLVGSPLPPYKRVSEYTGSDSEYSRYTHVRAPMQY
jgi:hypothetical protein